MVIQTTLTEIDAVEYTQTIEHLISKKMELLKGGRKLEIKQKIANYLLQKGFMCSEFKALLNERLP